MTFKSSSVRIVQPYELSRKLIVRPFEAGLNVLDFFAFRFPYISKNEWAGRVEKGWITRDGNPLQQDGKIRANDTLMHYTPAVREPSVPASVEVLRETENWLMVYKPAPLPMHQGGRYFKNTLIYILEELGYGDVKMVHRLDSVTSGLVLAARNKETALRMRTLFETGRVKKWYYALVEGEVKSEFTVDVPVRRKNGFIFECGDGLTGAKEARTEVYPVKSEGGRTLVRCVPVTGRTHQIRLHLQHAGYPIIDDPIYGPMGDTSGRKLQNSAIKLQSSGIEIEELSISDSLPAPIDWLEQKSNFKKRSGN